jgi:PAS domain S-box-containing protein
MIDLDVLHEPDRLAALRSLALANLEPEEAFDRLTRLAAVTCLAPAALITFVADDAEHFKSARRLPQPLATKRQIPLSHSIGQYAVVSRLPLVVPDTAHHPDVCTNPAVNEFGIAAYAAAPLIASSGHCLGTIAVLDWTPREWTEEQVAMLRDLAATTVTELELRRELAERARMETVLTRAQRELSQSEEHFRSLIEHTSDVITIVDENGVVLYGSPSVERVLGYPPERLVGRPAEALVHQDDLPRILEAHHAALRDPGVAQRGVEFRLLRSDGCWRVFEALGSAFQYRSAGPRTVLTLRDITDLRASHEQLRRLAHRLDEVREEELTKISREIHDELGHALTTLRLDLSWLVPKLRRSPVPVRHRAAEMLELVDDTIETVRRIASGLRPPVLDDLGLVAALEALLARFAEQTGIRVELEADDDDLPNAARGALYRIVQEALTNVARHARATRVRVVLESSPDRLLLEITDDGIGIPSGRIESSGSLGLVGMRERAMALGAGFEIEGAPGGGTTIRATLPRTLEAVPS